MILDNKKHINEVVKWEHPFSFLVMALKFIGCEKGKHSVVFSFPQTDRKS